MDAIACLYWKRADEATIYFRPSWFSEGGASTSVVDLEPLAEPRGISTLQDLKLEIDDDGRLFSVEVQHASRWLPEELLARAELQDED